MESGALAPTTAGQELVHEPGLQLQLHQAGELGVDGGGERGRGRWPWACCFVGGGGGVFSPAEQN